MFFSVWVLDDAYKLCVNMTALMNSSQSDLQIVIVRSIYQGFFFRRRAVREGGELP